MMSVKKIINSFINNCENTIKLPLHSQEDIIIKYILNELEEMAKVFVFCERI